MGLLEMNRPWLSKVTFLNDLYEYGNTSEDPVAANSIRSFVHEIARKMRQSLFAQGEQLGKHQELYILNQGIVSRKGKIYRSGTVWGLDFVLSDISLQVSPRSLSLTYVA